MGKSEREKGKRWEREVARDMRQALPGCHVVRGWQARAGSDAPDVDGTPFWVECKVGKRPPLRPALQQAVEASVEAGDKRPVVAVVKSDRQPPLVLMHYDDWLDLVGEWWERGNE